MVCKTDNGDGQKIKRNISLFKYRKNRKCEEESVIDNRCGENNECYNSDDCDDEKTVRTTCSRGTIGLSRDKRNVLGMFTLNDMQGSYETDLRNIELLYDEFSEDPFQVMRIAKFDDIPMIRGDNDVIIKVQVSGSMDMTASHKPMRSFVSLNSSNIPYFSQASTVSKIDCEIREGIFPWRYGQKPSLPIVPGAGEFGQHFLIWR